MIYSLATMAKFPLQAVKSGVVWEACKCGQCLKHKMLSQNIADPKNHCSKGW